MADQRAMQVAIQAAALLPEPPQPHDAFGYLAWEELVLTTAGRLQWLLDDATLLADPPQGGYRVSPGADGRLRPETLLCLAVLLAHGDAACSGLLAETLAS